MSKEVRQTSMDCEFLIRTKYVPCLSALLEQLIEKIHKPIILEGRIVTTTKKTGIPYEISSSGVKIGEGSSGAYYYTQISPSDFVKRIVYGDSRFPDLFAAYNLIVGIEYLSGRFGIKLTNKKRN